jgi:hypothetical protein
VDDAINACTRAVQMSPSELRFQYQLGRALGLRDRKRAFEIETALTRQKYPAILTLLLQQLGLLGLFWFMFIRVGDRHESR